MVSKASNTKKASKAEKLQREKAQALELAMKQIDKTYGSGSIMRLGDKKSFQEGRKKYFMTVEKMFS